MKQRTKSYNRKNYFKPLLLVSTISLAFISPLALATPACSDAAVKDIQDFLPKNNVVNTEETRNLSNRFEQFGVAEKLNEAGLFAQARTLLKAIYEDESKFSPQAALTYARAYRLQATDLNSAQFGTAPSEISAGRVACLEQADLYLQRYLLHLEGVINADIQSDKYEPIANVSTDSAGKEKPLSESASKKPVPIIPDLKLTAEGATVLYGLFSLERAETQMQLGDLLYSLEPQQFLGAPSATSLERQSAMVKYRAARVYLAMAEGARPKIETQDHAISRRAILAEKLNTRLSWINEGLFFNGLTYLQDTPFIGLERDEKGLVLSGSLQDALARFEKNQNKLYAQMSLARGAIWKSAKELRELDKDNAIYVTNLKSELFKELATLESRTGTHDINIGKVDKDKEVTIQDIQTRHTENLDELVSRRDATKAETKKQYEKVLADMKVVSGYISRESNGVLEEIWNGISEKAEAERKNAENDVLEEDTAYYLLPKLDDIADYKKRLIDDEINISLSGADTQELKNIDDSFSNVDTEWQALLDEKNDLQIVLANLEQQLLVQGEERLMVLAGTKKISVNDDVKFVQKLADERLSMLAKITSEQVAGVIVDLDERIAEESVQLQKKARDFVQNEIKQVNELIGNAEKVLQAVVDGAKNFQAASQAAQAVFTAMQAIPSGTGLVVIQDRASMVALKNEASKVIEFSIKSIQDAARIKAEIANLKRSVKKYEQKLKNINFELVKDGIKKEINAVVGDQRKKLVDNYKKRVEVIDQAIKSAGDLTVVKQRINGHKDTILGAEIVQTKNTIKKVKGNIKQVENRQKSLRLKTREAITTVWQSSQELSLRLRTVKAQNTQITDLETNFQNEKQKIVEKFEGFIAKIKSSRDLQQSRLAQLLLELEAIESGKPSKTQLGSNWELSRAAILGGVGDRLGYEANLADTYRLFDDSRQEVAQLLFEYANAMLVLTQDTKQLKWGAYVHSYEEAETAFRAMSRAYYQELRRYFGVKHDRVALKIDKSDVQSLLYTNTKNSSKQELPSCIIQREDSTPNNPDKCIRIRIEPMFEMLNLKYSSGEKAINQKTLNDEIKNIKTTRFQELDGDQKKIDEEEDTFQRLKAIAKKAPEVYEAEAEALKDTDYISILRKLIALEEIKKHPSLNGNNETVDLSAILPSSDKGDEEKILVFNALNNLLESPSSQSELVFAPTSLSSKTSRPRLLDVFLTHEKLNNIGLSGLRTVGPSWAACDNRIVNVIASDNPGFDKTSLNPGESMNPTVAREHLAGFKAAYEDTSGEFSVRMLRTIATQSALGRGIGNTFEVRVDDVNKLPDTMHLIIVFSSIKCDRSSGTFAAKVEPFESNVDLAKKDLIDKGQFVASSLIDFELALSKKRQDGFEAKAKTANEGAEKIDMTPLPDLLNRLDVLDSLNELIGTATAFELESSAPGAPKTDDEQAIGVLKDNWGKWYREELKTVSTQKQTAMKDRITSLVMLETRSGASIDPELIKSNPEKYGSFRRPPPLSAFEYVARLTIKSEKLEGGLAKQVARTLKDTAKLNNAIRPVLDLHKSSHSLMLGMDRLLIEGDKRMAWMDLWSNQMTNQFNNSDPFIALPEMLCAAFLMEKTDFWLSQIEDDRLVNWKKLNQFQIKTKSKDRGMLRVMNELDAQSKVEIPDCAPLFEKVGVQ